MIQKIFTNSVEDQSLYGTVTITYLDPFGTPSVSDLNNISASTITPINPYWLTIDPDYVYTQSDYVSLNPHKFISGLDAASALDDIQSLHFNKGLFDSQLTDDVLQKIDVLKRLKDVQVAVDRSKFTFDKNLRDEITSIIDNKAIALHKVYGDLLSSPIDSLQSLYFNKGLSESISNTDFIQSFSVIKVLRDYANPVDLVAIPDGSTFNLHKTLRNTVLPDDSYFVALEKLLSDVEYIADRPYIHVSKIAIDYVNNYDNLNLSYLKNNYDYITPSDVLSIGLDLIKSDTYSVNDFSSLLVQKELDSDSIALDNLSQKEFNKLTRDKAILDDSIQSFGVFKLLQDYANPVDLVNIPDGSTFVLNKTLRNTVLPTDEARFYWTYNRSHSDSISQFDETTIVDFVKVLKTLQQASDSLEYFDFNKVLRTDQSIDESLAIYLRKTEQSYISEIEDKKYLRLDKIFTDELINGSIFDDISSLNLNKVLTHSVNTDERIQSFSVFKLLQDYANPVDLVSIPDGSTFQLDKTLRNTVLPTDEARFYWTYNRSHSDIFGIDDFNTLLINKALNNTVLSSEQIQYFDFNKVLDQLINVNELAKLNLEKYFGNSVSLNDFKSLTITKTFINNATLSDFNALYVNKALTEEITLIEKSSFDVFKLLQDYANPVDLVSIPDGSTFVLNKTLRNTVLSNDQTSLVWRFNRSFNHTTSVNDYSVLDLQKPLEDTSYVTELRNISLTKVLSDYVSVNDELTFGRSFIEIDQTSVLDNLSFGINKSLSDSYSYSSTTDSISNISFNKTLNDISTQLDSIQSFSVFKLLQDYANPVDLVSIPDGSTFVLNKTLRNTVLPTDDISFIWNYVRGLSDEVSQFDEQLTFRWDYVRKFDDFYDFLLNSETQKFAFNKLLTDSVSVIDSLSYDGVNSEEYSDFTSTTDASAFSFNKKLSDKLGDARYYNLNANLDFNNNDGNYDIDIENGLIDLNNQDFYIDGVILDNTILRTSKHIFDNQYINDIYALTTEKPIFDSVILSDIKTLNFNLFKSDIVQSIDYLNKSFRKTLSDQLLVIDHINVDSVDDFTQSTTDSSFIDDSGYLRMTDYADIMYFAEDYVGESRSFT